MRNRRYTSVKKRGHILLSLTFRRHQEIASDQRVILTMFERRGPVVKPEAHGTQDTIPRKAVRPGCRDPAVLASLGSQPTLPRKTYET